MPIEQRIKADSGFEICDECQGYGFVKSDNLMGYEFCPDCRGTGQVDWIKHIIGKPEVEMFGSKCLIFNTPTHGETYIDYINQTLNKYDKDNKRWVIVP